MDLLAGTEFPIFAPMTALVRIPTRLANAFGESFIEQRYKFLVVSGSPSSVSFCKVEARLLRS